MTVEEAKEHKKEAEAAILAILKEFQEATGVMVRDVEIETERITFMSAPSVNHIQSVALESIL